MVEIKSGHRLALNDEIADCLIKQGSVEIYAVSNNKEIFQQIYIMEMNAGDVIFPFKDDMGSVSMVLYAKSDCIIQMEDVSSLSLTELCQAAGNWFKKIVNISWINKLANFGDEVIISWQKNKVFSDIHDSEQFWHKLQNNQDIFNVLLFGHFSGNIKKYVNDLKIRKNYKKHLLDQAVGSLMLEDERRFVIDGGSNYQKNVGAIIKCIATSMKLPTAGINLPTEIAKKLDQFTLMRRLVAKANMEIRMISLENGWYREDCGHIIGYYGTDKMVSAFLPDSPGSYIMVNEANPNGVAVTPEIAAKLDKNAFACYAGLPLKSLGASDVCKFIVNHIWMKDVRTILTASIVVGLMAMIIPNITETVFTDIILIYDFSALATVTQIAVVSAFTTFIVSVARSLALMRLSTHGDVLIQSAVISRLLRMPLSFFQKYQAGDLAKRLMGLQELKTVFMGNSISTLLSFVFSFCSLLLMAYYSVKLTIICLFLWIVYFAILCGIYRKYVIYNREKVTLGNKLSGMVMQIFSGLTKFRINGAEEQAYYMWAKNFGKQWSWNLKMRWNRNYASILGAVQPIIMYLIIYYVIMDDVKFALEEGKDPAKEVIEYAKFIAFQTAFIGFNTSINQIVPIVAEFFSIRPYLENLSPILKEETEVQEEKPDAEPLSGNIEIDNLSFSYSPEASPVLRNISLKIEARENVAIVGKSGCGKSTLIKLLLGFNKPSEGAIFYDDQNLADVNATSVRNQMGVVLQNGQLMTGDIFSNIVGTTSLNIDDAWAAAESAGLADDIRNMAMGMHTVISEGSGNISGGQKQRILIARALAGKPSIIIFDEATSALDNRTQSIVTDSLEKLNVTRIVVAHRLSTIKNCDRIIVLDKGSIAECGTYEELIAKDGIFAEMAKRQMV